MIPFSPPRVDQKTLDAVNEVLLSGWITTGPKTKLFERKLEAYLNSKKVFCVNSATAAYELLLLWYGIGPGDEVIVPAYTYSATGNVVLRTGAKLVLVDAKADDFNIDVNKIKAAITPHTKVIVPVDLGGFPCDYHALFQLVNSTEIKNMFSPSNERQRKLGRIMIAADPAHSIGARYDGKMIGSVADACVFSFHAVKNLTTAEGGALSLNLPDDFDHEEAYKEFNIKSLHGQTKDALSKTVNKGAWRYDIVEPGFKCNLTDIASAIGLVELERYESETLSYRKFIFDKFSEALSKYPWAQVPVYETAEKISSYHVYMFRVKGVTEAQRDAIIQGIFDRDVACNVHFQPLPLFTAYKERGYKIEDYPVAYDNYSREISLPVHLQLTVEQINHVIQVVVDSVEAVLKS
jgi:dTDP-4-amino-4,6-dideoxygalactose transaminase